jgi:hypothetical protein
VFAKLEDRRMPDIRKRKKPGYPEGIFVCKKLEDRRIPVVR